MGCKFGFGHKDDAMHTRYISIGTYTKMLKRGIVSNEHGS